MGIVAELTQEAIRLLMGGTTVNTLGSSCFTRYC